MLDTFAGSGPFELIAPGNEEAQRWRAGLSDLGASYAWCQARARNRVNIPCCGLISTVEDSRQDWSYNVKVNCMTQRPAERVRAKLTDETIREIRRRLALGYMQHDIAADLGINQGRVSEINTGKRRPANDNQLGLI